MFIIVPTWQLNKKEKHSTLEAARAQVDKFLANSHSTTYVIAEVTEVRKAALPVVEVKVISTDELTEEDCDCDE